MNRYKVYCGPTLVKPLAALLTHEVYDASEGTAHVYVTSYCTHDQLLDVLNTVSSGFTHRDVQQLY